MSSDNYETPHCDHCWLSVFSVRPCKNTHKTMYFGLFPVVGFSHQKNAATKHDEKLTTHTHSMLLDLEPKTGHKNIS